MTLRSLSLPRPRIRSERITGGYLSPHPSGASTPKNLNQDFQF